MSSLCPPPQGWRLYLDRRVLTVLLLGFSSGLPLALTGSSLTAWLAKDGISIADIGEFALVASPYAFKYLWSPFIDRLPPPLPLGRRRGWGIAIQLALMAATLGVGLCDPHRQLWLMAALATLVAFLSASQDIVIDAFRVELLEDWQQGAGAGATQVGYRLGMVASGAGALFLAEDFGWFVAYAVMAGLVTIGIAVLLACPEPEPTVSAATRERERRATGFLAARPHLRGRRAAALSWLYGTLVCPFSDFVTRPRWLAIVFLVIGYKLGEAMAGSMANPLYISLGFTLKEIGTVSKIFGPLPVLAGGLIGGMLVARIGTLRALLLCGVLQSLGNLFYVLQVHGGHDVRYLIVCVLAENFTGGMAGAAMVAYLSGLCNLAYTATHYALLSSLAAIGRSLLASRSGVLVQSLGWVDFFLLTTFATVPALLLLLWLMRKPPAETAPQPAS